VSYATKIAYAAVFSIALLFIPLCQAQAPAEKPKFEVASIKRSAPGQNGMAVSSSGNRFRATNATVQSLIMNAYPVHSFQIVGGPNWINTDGFDIEAVSEVPLTAESAKQMLQVLLKDRFLMGVHQEMRDMPLYRLVVAKDGPKVQAAKEDERTGVYGAGRGRMNFQHVPVSTLADNLALVLDRLVLDQTALAGYYTFKLEWTPDGVVNTDSNAPSLFTALEEQLGLKLESARGPVEVLVIDSASKPSEN
jgi:uncharacterized protein (TIGR03435 family)